MLKNILLLILVFLGFHLNAQDNSIRGFVYDDGNMEPISDIKVKLLKQDSSVIAGAYTNLNGGFLIPKLMKGSYIVKVEVGGYKKSFVNVEITDKQKIYDVQFKLIRSTQEVKEVVVDLGKKEKKNEVLIGTLKYNKEGLERIPVHGGENDIVGAISVTPGVITTGDQGGQLYVRGGTPIQNKVLLDGMTIYNPFHSIGFFSIFETELVKNVDVYTGGFESKYGGRVSSVMDITYRDGNRKEFGGRVSASPFLAKMVLEGPIGKATKEKAAAGSYVFSAKHSLLDYTSKSLYPKVNGGNGLPFNFTDLYGKVTFNADGGTKVSAFGFHNQDSVNYDVANLRWDASGGGVNFLMVPSGSPLFVRGHVNGSNYQTTFTETAQEPRYSKIGGFDLGFDFSYFLKNESELSYGFNINGFNTEFVTYNEAKRKIEAVNFTTEIGSYFNFRHVGRRWVIQPGLRVQVYASLNTISPEPRLGLKYNATENLRFKFSGGRFSQNFTSASSDKDVVNLFNGLLSAPTNVQEEFVTQFQNVKNIKNGLQYAWHAILGFEYDLGKLWSFNIEGYYKYFNQLSNINQNKLYNDVSQFELIDDVFKKDFIIESGQSYGVDVLAKYNKDRIFFWAVYSFGKNTRWDGFNTYAPVFDRRHNLNIVGSYLLGKKKELEFNVRWNLGSGLPFTPNAGNYQAETFANGVTSNYVTNNPSYLTMILGTFNSQRLPYYHRLDITLKKHFNLKNKDVLEMIASVTNVYNRNNIFYVNRVTGEQIYQFPVLPSFGLNYKF
ncbi:MAG: TonB-dependent receptor [Crocinitomicaceae bacterium]